jgi:hypothetical protein
MVAKEGEIWFILSSDYLLQMSVYSKDAAQATNRMLSECFDFYAITLIYRKYHEPKFGSNNSFEDRCSMTADTGGNPHA